MRNLQTLFLSLLLCVGAATPLQGAPLERSRGDIDSKRSRGFFNAAIFDHVFIGRAILERNREAPLGRMSNGLMPIHAATYMGNLEFIRFLVDEMGVNHPFIRPSGQGENPTSAHDLALQGESTPEILEYYESLQRDRVFSEWFSEEGKHTFENDLSSVHRSCTTEW